MDSLNILLAIDIRSLFTFMANFGYFPVAMFFWNNFSTYLLGVRKNNYVSNNDYFSLIKINQNDLGKMIRVSRPFLLSTFHYHFIIHIWSLSWFMVQDSKILEFLSFIGTKIFHGLKGLADIISNGIQGLRLLHLRGKGGHWGWDQSSLPKDSINIPIEGNLSKS